MKDGHRYIASEQKQYPTHEYANDNADYVNSNNNE
jgi:hypothetical protein